MENLPQTRAAGCLVRGWLIDFAIREKNCAGVVFRPFGGTSEGRKCGWYTETVIAARGEQMQAKLESLEAIERELAELSAQNESAKHRLLVLIEAFARADGWSRQGFVSCAAFLSYRVGLGKVAAREHVRVARALPEIAESLAAGALSFSKVRALTRVANPQNEAELCSVAKAGTAAHVERLVRAMHRAQGPADSAAANPHHEARYVQLRPQEDGSLELRAKLPAELGAIVQKAIEVALEQQEREQDAAQTTHGQRCADALVQLAESALSAYVARGVPAERVQVVLHLEAAVADGALGPERDASASAGAPKAVTSPAPSADAPRRGVATAFDYCRPHGWVLVAALDCQALPPLALG